MGSRTSFMIQKAQKASLRRRAISKIGNKGGSRKGEKGVRAALEYREKERGKGFTKGRSKIITLHISRAEHPRGGAKWPKTDLG